MPTNQIKPTKEEIALRLENARFLGDFVKRFVQPKYTGQDEIVTLVDLREEIDGIINEIVESRSLIKEGDPRHGMIRAAFRALQIDQADHDDVSADYADRVMLGMTETEIVHEVVSQGETISAFVNDTLQAKTRRENLRMMDGQESEHQALDFSDVYALAGITN